MRRMYTTEHFQALGLARGAVRWGEKKGRWRQIEHGVYGEGPEPPTLLDRGIALAVATDGVVSGLLAGVLHGLDGVELREIEVTVPPGSSVYRACLRRRALAPDRVVHMGQIRCTDGLQTMLDLAPPLDDLTWECALECALRKGVATMRGLAEATRERTRGGARMRRVLALRADGAPPTESMLETLMVQLARTIPGLPPPVRQYRVYDEHGQFVARVDLCWPELGLFVELDGQQHKDQPVYDARRETAVVAATGWLCGRFTWREVVHLPIVTARRLAAVAEQARRRPLPA
jgi:hypothetical protein